MDAGRFSPAAGGVQSRMENEERQSEFLHAESLAGNVDVDPERRDVFQLTTFRSQGQFNTTIYSDRDRFRGISGTRMVLFMNRNDIERLDLAEGDVVSLRTEVGDDMQRQVDGFIVHGYNIPEGCLGAYYPECNPLIPIWHHAKGSKVPASKGIPVSIAKGGAVVEMQ